MQDNLHQNYQRVLDELVAKVRGLYEMPSLLLHSCCAPCSSYVLEYLSEFFKITIFYFNPNIDPPEEYERRKEEQENFLKLIATKHPINFQQGDYDPAVFYNAISGTEHSEEGGERCFRCYELRLRKAGEYAKEHDFDFFGTTLSISPHKNAGKLNEIGRRIEEECGIHYLYSDFKKKNGFKRSIELSKQYGLYRQDYCGCIFSRKI